MVCWVLAEALLEKFGGDTVAALDAALVRYRDSLATRLQPSGDR